MNIYYTLQLQFSDLYNANHTREKYIRKKEKVVHNSIDCGQQQKKNRLGSIWPGAL